MQNKIAPKIQSKIVTVTDLRKPVVRPAAKKALAPKTLVAMDGIKIVKKPAKITRIHYARAVSTPAPIRRKISWRFVQSRQVAVGAAVLSLVLAFGSGVWVELNTTNTLADANSNVTPGGVVTTLGTIPTSTLESIPNDVFNTLTVDQVEGYMREALKTPEMKQAEQLADRKTKLTAYLEEKNSPLVSIVDTLVNLKHWQMVLAISNSESSLGKHCYTNNCSGIGVAPGDELWREYDSKAAWAKDLDRLIDKRYKDWTLEEMNGVYNKPGSANWVSASKQILEELQERGIE